MSVSIKKNVVESLYVVHCLVSGVGCNEFVKAESDNVAKAKAMSNLRRVYEDVGECTIVSLERIDPNEVEEEEV